jgi:prevent-host-death family protein
MTGGYRLPDGTPDHSRHEVALALISLDDTLVSYYSDITQYRMKHTFLKEKQHMEKVDVDEAKTYFSILLERVTNGDRITITKHGVPVAVLLPYDPEESVETELVIRQLYEFRELNSLAGLRIRDMIEEDSAL